MINMPAIRRENRLKALKIKALPRFCLALVWAGILAACAASGPRVEVTRFHELDVPRGERFLIEAEAGIEPGLEFENYAAQLAQYMIDYGYTPTGERPPQIIATLGYDAQPDPNYYAGGGPYLGFGVGGFGSHVGGSVSTTVDMGGDDDIYYRHTVTLRLREGGSGKRIYEGSATGYTRGEYWPGMMPRLLRALFMNWPGESGTTERVKLEDY